MLFKLMQFKMRHVGLLSGISLFCATACFYLLYRLENAWSSNPRLFRGFYMKESSDAVNLNSSFSDPYFETETFFKTVDKTFIILDWSGFNFHPEVNRVLNCQITRDKTLINVSDAVVITQRKQLDIKGYPRNRHSWQRWVWCMDESPVHAFINSEVSKFGFNWTMTYRVDSDIYIPYGWTIKLSEPREIPNNIANRTKVVTAMMSSCNLHNNARWKYVVALNQTVYVEGYGNCFHKMCPGYRGGTMWSKCPLMSDYLFYLAFENSNCQEYITEKMFVHGYAMGSVPVVLGPSKADYNRLAPPNSFIYARDFSSPAELGEYLTFLSRNRTEYMKYHEWRKHYKINFRLQYINETGIWTKLCKKLNQDTRIPKVYPEMLSFWSPYHCEPTIH